jgi:uncharacterized protein YfbU (UPF0304 family)
MRIFFLMVLLCFTLQRANAAENMDCKKAFDTATMHTCVETDYKNESQNLDDLRSSIKAKIHTRKVKYVIFLADEDTWNDSLPRKCSNKTLGINATPDGFDGITRLVCKINLTKNHEAALKARYF